jgi:hypothetical protein
MRVYGTKKAIISLFLILLCPVFLFSSVVAYTVMQTNAQKSESPSGSYDKTVIIDLGTENRTVWLLVLTAS